MDTQQTTSKASKLIPKLTALLYSYDERIEALEKEIQHTKEERDMIATDVKTVIAILQEQTIPQE